MHYKSNRRLQRSFVVSLLAAAVFAPAAFGGNLASVGRPPVLAGFQTAAAAPVADRRKALAGVFTDYWEDELRHSPETASAVGDKRYNDRITDYSVAAYDAGIDRGRDFLARLAAIDPAGLPEQDVLSRDLLIRQLVEQQDEAQFKPWEMPLTQEWGLHIEAPQFADLVTFDTVKDYDDYIARLKKLPDAFTQITSNLSAGVDDGRLPPKYLLEKVLAQVNKIAGAKPEESPFAAPLKRFPASITAEQQERIRTDLIAAITRLVLPAYARLGRFLESQYVPHGRTDAGIWALPDGDEYYGYLVRHFTTTNLKPSQIHQIGLDEVKRDEAEMLAIAQKLGYKDLASLHAAMVANPKMHPHSADELLAAYQGHIDAMRPKLPQLFGRLPKAPLEVRFVPEYMEQEQSQAYYWQGTPDGKRPGVVYVNRYQLSERLLSNVEAISYHEGIPGHHLQISIAQELDGLPEFRKQAGYTAFVEGWALYSEQLGKDVGFYQDPYSDYGRLEADMWRAIRLVVDTGVHSKHWTRDQVVDYFRAHSTMDDTNIQSETDRYIAWPGQALAYKLGQLKIMELRSRAQQALGAKFDIKAFHDEVLDAGALPLDVLDARVQAWIDSQVPAAKTAK